MNDKPPRLFGLPTDATVFVGLIAAPAIGGSSGTLLLFLANVLRTGDASRLIDAFSAGLSFGFVTGLVFGIPAAFIIGLPVHTLMFRRGLVHAWHYLLFGALIGTINALALALVTGTISNPGFPLLLFGICGALGGVVFWLIRRPDRDAVSASPTP